MDPRRCDAVLPKSFVLGRTVAKQIPRLEKDGLITRGKRGYDATDSGLYELIQHSGRTAKELGKIVAVAKWRFPNGRTMKQFAWMLTGKAMTRQTQLKRFHDWCRRVDEMLVKNRVPADHYFKIEITADQAGRITVRQNNGPKKRPRPRGYVWRTLSDAEVEEALKKGPIRAGPISKWMPLLIEGPCREPTRLNSHDLFESRSPLSPL